MICLHPYPRGRHGPAPILFNITFTESKIRFGSVNLKVPFYIMVKTYRRMITLHHGYICIPPHSSRRKERNGPGMYVLEFKFRSDPVYPVFRVQLDMEDGINRIRAELKFKNIHPWPVTLFSPGTMGWYAYVPMMECYHATVSFDHDIEGYFEVNGAKTDFTLGKGYIEKDWGRSMPSSWIWMQTNHFDEDEASLFGSVAKIPWLGSYFTGYIFGFYYKKKIYRFATYTGARVDRLSVSDDRIDILIEDKRHYLEISADRASGIDLPAPKLGEMTAKVNESLKSKIRVSFYKKTKQGRDIIFSGEGRNAGLEFVGNIKELLRGFNK